MKKKPASKSAFFNQRVLIGFSFCLIGLVLALAAFNAYPGGNAVAAQQQAAVYENQLANLSAASVGNPAALSNNDLAPEANLNSLPPEVPFAYTEKAPYPTFNGLSRHATATFNNFLYVIAGESLVGATFAPTTAVQRFDPAANTWAVMAPVPTAVSNHEACAMNGKIYIPGGYGGSGPPFSNINYIYDITSNTWSTGAVVPAPATLWSSVTCDGAANKVYVIGGFDGTVATSATKIYDATANTWSTGAVLPAVRYGVDGGLISGNIYVAGGSDGTTTFATVFRYNIAGNSWTTVAPMTIGCLYGAAGVDASNRLWITGGGFCSNAATVTGRTEMYDPVANTWTTTADVLNELVRHTNGGFAGSGNTLFNVAAGFNGTTSILNTQQVTVPAGGTPTPSPSVTPSATPPATPTPSASVSPTPCGGTLTFNADAASLGSIPDGNVGGNICGDFGAPRDVTFTVTGVTGPLTAVQVVMTSGSPTHTWVGDLDVSLRAPGGAPTATLFKQTGEVTSATGCGDSSDVSGPYNFFDAAPATPTFWNAATTAGAAAPVAPGNYRATTPGGSAAGGAVTTITPNFTGLTSGQINGTWTLRIVDGGEGDTGAITAAQLILTGTGGCATPTPSASGTPATPTPTATPSVTATPCPGGSNVIVDGTFEAGTPWSAWTVQSSTNFGTPMCDAGCGTGGGTAGGFGGSANWAWFGGTASAETATTGQSVVIGAGGSASMTFQLWIGAVNAPFTDVLNVRVDGTTVASFVEPGTAELGYTQRTVNLNAFANGASHAILFEYVGPGGAVSNFSVDNVSVVAGGACATPTPSSTPSATAVPSATATPSASCAPAWSAGPNMPPAAVLRAVGVYFPANGRFYSVGGRTSDLVGSDTVNPFEYNPATNAWTTTAAVLPDAQVNNMVCGVLTVSGTPQIYCVGGSQATVTGTASRVFSFNPATNAVATLAAGDNWPGSQGGTFLPGGAAVHGNKLYVIGGVFINATGTIVVTNQVWQFDPTAAVGSKWLARANFPVSRGYVPTVTIGNFIYTAGGSDADVTATLLVDTADAFRYDPVANTWSATDFIPDMPRVTAETRAVVVDGKMWVLGGGRTVPNPSAQVDIYDPVANSWSTGLPFDGVGRRNFPADSNGTDRVFLAGGYDNLASQVNTMRIYGAGVCASPTPSIAPSATPSIAPSATPSIAPSATPSATVGVSPTPGITPGASTTPAVSPTPGITPSAQAVNLSTRMRVLTGDRVGIGGFIVSGSGPKNVLIRAIGPSLVRFGIDPADVLADPTLELRSSNALVLANNNWKENAAQRDLIEATGLPPTNDLESAIVATLNPGQYTAVVKGNGDTSGVALVEVYDLNQSSGSKLANLSTRAFVSTNNDIVIAGFILGNNSGDDSVIVRGIGPSLAAFGVTSVLANPTLELRDNNGALVLANNDWQDSPSQAALITAAGLAPSNNLESAIAATLPPGLYTALLAGLNNTSGNGLVEVYDLGAQGGGPVPTPTPTPPGGTPTPSIAPSPGASPSPGVSPSPTPPGATVTPTPPAASPTPSPTTCTESFDTVTAPALPSGWTASNEGTPPDNGVVWVTNTLTPDSAPNSAFIDDQNGVSDKYMVTRNIVINSAAPKITFRNFYSTEYDPPPTEEFWDGYVLEISINGGAFADITAPAADGGGAGTFVTGGYTGEINGIASNPLAGRQAWSGENTGYISTEINLGAHLNGQTVKLRFRMGSDLFSPGDGVHVDGLTINGGSCPP